ncbi:MAG: HupE/UreJ family protein [Gammaproteobacteria bacterium]
MHRHSATVNMQRIGLLLTLLIPLSTLAHTEGAVGGSAFTTGFMHPFGGLDHMLAMLAVGMWGAQLGMPALWILPVAFPLMMAVGGVTGLVGMPLPSIELGIALSVVMLGAVILFKLRPPIWASFLIVGFFAIFHGHAHGLELPGNADPLAYSIGFVVATGLIHIAGILIGFVTHMPRGMALLRAGGAAIAAAGVWIMMGVFA